MKQDPVISIITAVYNPDPRLFARCCDSVISQTYGHLEWLIVSDGCNERDLELLRSIADDPRFHVITLPHGGVSAARNAALIRCAGDYVTFLDADDQLEPFFLEEAIRALTANNADVVIGKLSHVYGNRIVSPLGKLDGRVSTIAGEALKSFIRFTVAGYPVAPNTWEDYFFVRPHPIAPRVYERKLIDGLLFDTGMSLSEDSLFGSRALARASTLALVDSVWYRYIQHDASATHTIDVSKVIQQMSSLDAYLQYADELQCADSDYGMRLATEMRYRFARGSGDYSLRSLYRCIAGIYKLPIADKLSNIEIGKYSLEKKQSAMTLIIKSKFVAGTCLAFRGASLRK